MHDFNQCLEFSHSASDLPIWREIYEKAFPSMIGMHDHRGDGEHQRAGIDRQIILGNSKQILIDEKVRRKDYGDILLEYLSVEEKNTPGWVCKPIRADYIAYAILPTGMCYLLPVQQLQSAWVKCGSEWISIFKPRRARNNGYTTVNVGVPANLLFRAIGSELRVEFTPIQEKELYEKYDEIPPEILVL